MVLCRQLSALFLTIIDFATEMIYRCRRRFRRTSSSVSFVMEELPRPSSNPDHFFGFNVDAEIEENEENEFRSKMLKFIENNSNIGTTHLDMLEKIYAIGKAVVDFGKRLVCGLATINDIEITEDARFQTLNERGVSAPIPIPKVNNYSELDVLSDDSGFNSSSSSLYSEPISVPQRFAAPVESDFGWQAFHDPRVCPGCRAGRKIARVFERGPMFDVF
ncbi:unnamed protein product [Caenorhabditis sp. 36 PRJEB53466]|nr:unnamed protein product [Caenorhabditis sp. 36 PRJEB53466]